MSEQAVCSTPEPVATFDMKAGQYNLPTLVLRSAQIDGLDAFLASHIARLPAFFDQAPIAIDVSALPQDQPFADFPLVVGMLRGHGLVPIGVRGASAEQREQARALELAVLPPGRRVPARAAEPAVVATPPARAPALVIDKPVRSGQRIVAERGDLVLAAGVSSGAEVVAAGHIHCYGALRGRAMAGFAGDRSAQIFCSRLGAELVSIAGRYRVSENLDSRHVGRAVRIALDGDTLRFEML